MMVIELLAYFAIEFLIICLICKIVAAMIKAAVVYSKIALSLFLALFINLSNPIPNINGMVSYLIWAAILAGALLLLSRLPRLNCALDFSCTAVISYMIAEMLSGIFFSFLELCFGTTYNGHSLVVVLLLKAICVYVSYRSLMTEIDNTNMNHLNNPILILIERIAASVIYGIGIYIVVVSGLQYDQEIWDYVILAFAVVIPFLVDWIYTR